MAEIIEVFGIQKSQAHRDIALLKENELIVFKGAAKTGSYALHDKLLDKIGDISQ